MRADEVEVEEERGVSTSQPDEVDLVDEARRFRIDLPQYVESELHLPRVRPLAPLPDAPPPPRGVRAWLRAAATDWRVKGVVQKVLGVVPGGQRLHAVLQRQVGGLKNFPRECDVKVDDWRLMMQHLASARVDIARATLLEIGTGWYPTFPICLYLAGAAHVKTVDVQRLLDRALTLRMVDRLAMHLSTIAGASRQPEDVVRARYVRLGDALRRGASLAAATDGAIDYRAPSDAACTDLPAGSVDVVSSNSVLEHVPPQVIEACFVEAMRILRPGGIVFHSVNCGDHYAYTDRRIDQLHYLAYSDEAWQKWNNTFLYQNRLRAIDFTTMCRRAGFAIELDTARAHPKRLEQLGKIAVHPRFARYARDQLAITSIDFIGRKPADGVEN